MTVPLLNIRLSNSCRAVCKEWPDEAEYLGLRVWNRKEKTDLFTADHMVVSAIPSTLVGVGALLFKRSFDAPRCEKNKTLSFYVHKF